MRIGYYEPVARGPESRIGEDSGGLQALDCVRRGRSEHGVVVGGRPECARPGAQLSGRGDSGGRTAPVPVCETALRLDRPGYERRGEGAGVQVRPSSVVATLDSGLQIVRGLLRGSASLGAAERVYASKRAGNVNSRRPLSVVAWPAVRHGAGARTARTSSRSLPVLRMPWGTPSGATSRTPASIGTVSPSSRKSPSPSMTW